MAFLVRNPPTDLVAMFAKATGYGTDSNAKAYGEIRGDGTADDLRSLRLNDAEAQRFAKAKAGDELNLSSAEIATLQALADKSTAAIEAALRTLLLERYRAYRAKGLTGIAPYDRGGGKSDRPGRLPAKATNASPVLAREAPEVVTALLEYPRAQPPKATESSSGSPSTSTAGPPSP